MQEAENDDSCPMEEGYYIDFIYSPAKEALILYKCSHCLESFLFPMRQDLVSNTQSTMNASIISLEVLLMWLNLT